MQTVAEILGRIDDSYPDAERVFREGGYLESMCFIKINSDGLELTQVGAVLANNLEWRDEKKSKRGNLRANEFRASVST